MLTLQQAALIVVERQQAVRAETLRCKDWMSGSTVPAVTILPLEQARDQAIEDLRLVLERDY